MRSVDTLTPYPFWILTAVVIAGFAVLGWMTMRTRARMKKMWGGIHPSGDAADDLLRRAIRAETKIEELEPRLMAAERAARTSIQKMGFLRFNPFQDTGGDQSFSIALLNQKNDGILISSLYMREGTRLYGKEVRDGAARQPLSDEEIKVLKEALSSASA